MSLQPEYPIANTLRLKAYGSFGIRVSSLEELKQAYAAAREKALPWYPLGEGSNIVPYTKVDGVVCDVALRGVSPSASGTSVIVEASAGENWHSFVEYCLERGWYGLENLALIPGRVGAAPIQNIGAYGVELSEFVEWVEVLDEGGQLVRLTRDECAFSYRDSIFKHLKVSHFRHSVSF